MLRDTQHRIARENGGCASGAGSRGRVRLYRPSAARDPRSRSRRPPRQFRAPANRACAVLVGWRSSFVSRSDSRRASPPSSRVRECLVGWQLSFVSRSDSARISASSAATFAHRHHSSSVHASLSPPPSRDPAPTSSRSSLSLGRSRPRNYRTPVPGECLGAFAQRAGS